VGVLAGMTARSKVIAVLAIFIVLFWIAVATVVKFAIETLMLVWYYLQIK
jgi:uncharacterized membrane protein YkgB